MRRPTRSRRPRPSTPLALSGPAVLLAAVLAVTVACGIAAVRSAAQEPLAQPAPTPEGELLGATAEAVAAMPTIEIVSTFPTDVPGGAPNASLTEAAVFAWQEFIAATWPAASGVRDTPDAKARYGDPGAGPLVWETFRGKVEIYPGANDRQPPGFVNDPAQDYGYDAGPQYDYANPVPPCPGQAPDGPTPWVNADESTQIALATMYAGAGPSGAPGQQIVFLAKANRTQYVYSTQPRPNGPQRPYANGQPPIDNSVYGLWNHGVAAGEPWETDNPAYNALVYNFAASYRNGEPPVEPYVEFPAGTIEVKAAWRQLGPEEDASRFHVQTVRTYRRGDVLATACWVDQPLALAALHIIQKTPSAPYFVFATFSQADNLLTAHGARVEDLNGKIVSPTGTTPLSPDVSTTASAEGSVRVALAAGPAAGQIESFTAVPPPAQPSAGGPAVDCTPGEQLYFRDIGSALPQGKVCVNERIHPIPLEIQQVNDAAHQAITAYTGKGDTTWLYYKLVNVQARPIDKPPGVLYAGGEVDPSTYYQANEVVETAFNLQVFSGRFQAPITGGPDVTNLITDYWPEGTPLAGKAFHNTYFDGVRYNMGGCMGCHGNTQVLFGTDFSFILQGGRTPSPDTVGGTVTAEIQKRYGLMLGQSR